MCLVYKVPESTAKLQRNRIDDALNDENFDSFPENQINSYENNKIEPDEVLHFAQELHNGILSKNVAQISNSLIQFSNQIQYYDQNRKICHRLLSDQSINFINANPIIADDFIICLGNLNLINNHLLVFDLIDYFSRLNYSFIDDILDRHGLDIIIANSKILEMQNILFQYIQVPENQDLLLKSIQILELFSENEKSYQQLANEAIMKNLLFICNSLFTNNLYKSIEEMSDCSILLLRRIVNIIVSDIQSDELPDISFFNQQQNQFGFNQNNGFNFNEICCFLKRFFIPNPNSQIYQFNFFPHMQYQAIKMSQLLYFDPYFINEVLPCIINCIPFMISMNKVEVFQLITKIYKYEDGTKEQMKKVKKMIPWEFLRQSLLCNSKDEVLAALSVLQTLFEYRPKMINIALRNNMEQPLACLVENASFDVKEKTLHVINSWLTGTDIDRDKQFFSNGYFADILFPLLQSPEEILKKQTYEILSLICNLNFNDLEFVKYIQMNMKISSDEC